MVCWKFSICCCVKTVSGTEVPCDRTHYTRNANLMSAPYTPAGVCLLKNTAVRDS